MNNHTPTPWKAVEKHDGWAIDWENPRGTLIASGINRGNDMGESDAKRIVACVNALADFDNETLLSGENLITRLVSERDEQRELAKQYAHELIDTHVRLREAERLIALYLKNYGRFLMGQPSSPEDVYKELKEFAAKAKGAGK